MQVIPKPRRAVVIAGCAALLCAGFASASRAQDGATGSGGAAGFGGVMTTQRGAEGALPVGDWLLFPTFTGSVVYDTNINQSSTNAQASTGFRLTPSILAENNNGIFKTTLYGMADGLIYTNPGSDNSGGDTVSVRTGAIENYSPLPDLTFNLQGDYTRQRDLFSTQGINHSVTSLNPTGIGLAPTTNPVSYNQFTGTASVDKTFGRTFVSLGGSVVDILYDNTSTGGTSTGAPSPNGVAYTGTGRGGFWITPVLYTFVEGSLDSRNYDTNTLSSTGYRALAGLGSEQIGLFRGEVYGGYQAEDYNSGTIGTVGSTVYGGRGYYYALPELTISAAVDETIGASLLPAGSSSSQGSSTRVTSFLGQADYSLAREWTASGRAGYIHTEYVGGTRRDDAWTVGATFTYSIWQSLGLTLDYQHLELNSNVAFQGFSRDVVTLGASYKY